MVIQRKSFFSNSCKIILTLLIFFFFSSCEQTFDEQGNLIVTETEENTIQEGSEVEDEVDLEVVNNGSTEENQQGVQPQYSCIGKDNKIYLNKQSEKRYFYTSPISNNCQKAIRTRTCESGSWSSWMIPGCGMYGYNYEACIPIQDTTFDQTCQREDGSMIAEGASDDIPWYKEKSVVYPKTCTVKYQKRTCVDGKLSKLTSINDATYRYPACTVTFPETELNVVTESQRWLGIINKYRVVDQKCGTQLYRATSLLKWNAKLELAATKHSLDMFTNNYFSHTGLNGSRFWDRIDDVGYTGYPVGENIYMGIRSIESAVEGWIKSPGHCQNIMNPSASEVGVGAKESYWTMVLGWD